MKNINTNRLVAKYMREYLMMPTSEFDTIEKKELTMMQTMAYNYVLKSKCDTKVADKVMAIIKEDDESFFEPFSALITDDDLKK